MLITSHSTTSTFLLGFSPSTSSRSPPRSIPPPQFLHGGICLSPVKDQSTNCGFQLSCSAVSRAHAEEHTEVLSNGLPGINWPQTVQDDIGRETHHLVPAPNKIEQYVDAIRLMFGAMNDGEISVSAYDTAWVALVEDMNGSGAPQFPTCLEWIAKNQLPDGSWGDSDIFSAHDRIINTLACVIALKSWKTHPEECQKGMKFIKENICKLEDENAEHMPIGFEVAFPSLIEIARKLDIKVAGDSPVLQEIYARRDLKLTRIPREIMHKVPTTLLHSLEGMPDLDWEKLLKLQSSDGSFLFSPSSTAFALMQTKDHNCLAYLSKAVQKFNGGVPNVYPVDLFEHIWAVDRMERLGISRYFESEIKNCIDYVHRYWTQEGICWARNSLVHDIDDTAMGFRLLRLHGHEVSADVFKHFRNGGEFFAFAGQSNQAVTGMFNLYRASQVLFPGESILEEAKRFSSKFLRAKQASNELCDKWIITKDLPGEVGYALDVPWYASLPRLETRFYLEQYGGEEDVWIGKTLYRMPYVNNNRYLELAKLDYSNCQALHQHEWNHMQKWYTECNLGDFGFSRRSLLLEYYLAAASLFEPEKSRERLAWAKTSILAKTIFSYFDGKEQRNAFLHDFRNTRSSLHFLNNGRAGHRLLGILIGTLNQFSLDALVAHGRDIQQHLRHAWEMCMMNWEEGSVVGKSEAELIVRTISICAGRWLSGEVLVHPQYQRLSEVASRVCYQLRQFQRNKVNGDVYKINRSGMTTQHIESGMQELSQLVLTDSSDGIDAGVKQTFLTVARTFYYAAYCDPRTINFHVAKEDILNETTWQSQLLSLQHQVEIWYIKRF